VLVGWLGNIAGLKSVLPGMVAMKANTAVGFILAGLALALLHRAAHSAPLRMVSQICAGAVALLGLLTLLQYLFGVDFGIDQLLFREPIGAINTLSPGRMAPVSAVNFLLLGVVLLLTGVRRAVPLLQWLAFIVIPLVVLPLLGYLYQAPSRYGLGYYTQVALHTAVFFLSLSLGVLLLHPADGPMQMITRDTLGGWLLRRMAPFVIGVPLLIGWLRNQGEAYHYFDGHYGRALLMVTVMLLLAGVFWWAARSLDNIDTARSCAEAEVYKNAAEIHATLYGIGDGVITTDVAGRITRMNPVTEQLTGWRETEALGRPVTEVFHIINEATRVEVENPVARVLREGTVVGLANHTLLIARDGTEYAIADSGAPIRDAQDAISGVVLIFRNVTADRQAEHVLLASVTRYRRLFESAKDGILILDAATGMIVDVNPSLIELLGYPQEEFIGKQLWELGLFDDIVASEEAFTALQRDQDIRYEDLPLVTKDGHRIEVEFVSSIYPVDDTMVVQCNIRDITARKQAEEALRASELRHRTLFEGTTEGIIMVDLTTLRFSYANPAMCAMLGYTEEQLRQLGLADIHPPEALERVTAVFEAFSRGELPTESAVPCRRRDGTIFYAAVNTGHPLVIDDRKHIVGFFTDITQRKQAQDALQESEAHYRSLFDNMLNGYAYCQMLYEQDTPVDFIYLAVNDAFATLTGLTEVIGRKASDVIPGLREEDPELIAAYGRVARTGMPETIENYVPSLQMWFAISLYSPHRDYFVTVFDVITQRKRLEKRQELAVQLLERLNQSQDTGTLIGDILRLVKVHTGIEAVGIRLREGDDFPYFQTNGFSEHFVNAERQVCVRSESGAVIRDADGQPMLACMCGNILCGRFNPSLPFFTPYGSFWSNGTTELLATTTEPDRQSATRNRCNAEGYESVALIPLRSGADIIGLLQLNDHRKGMFTLEMIRFFEGMGASIGIALAHQQADEQRSVLEAQLRRQQRLETVGQLAAGVAHDFNNLLTGITGFTQFALDTAPENSTSRQDLTEVLALSQRAADLTRQLLAFSRRQPLQTVVLDLNQLIFNLLKMLGRLIGEHIALAFDPDMALGHIKADPGQLEQVIVNLAVNARDAMPEGGKLTIATANVELDEEYANTHADTTPGAYILLTVTDNGCGMDDSVCEHLFEPFFTTKGVGKGTGLGLATSYGIVKQHGGSLWVESAVGQGTTFHIYLPRVAEPLVIEATPVLKTLPPGTATVLIVEDESAVREVTARLLEHQGYHVLTAALPSEAEQVLAIHGHDISLLLTDVVLPERSGRQLYEAIRRRYPHIRVLYVSGYTDDAIVRQGMLDENSSFIAKPFTADALIGKVSELLSED